MSGLFAATDSQERIRRMDHFESRVRPVLSEHCLRCHGEKKQEGGLRLDSPAGWKKGGESGEALVPGDPAKSLLMRAVRRTDKDLQMPPKKELSAQQIADLERWIAEGAEDPRTEVSAAFNAQDMESGKRWWAFQPVRKPSVPHTGGDTWSRTPIDHFVYQKLRAAGLQPSPEADKRALIRRATFGLTGLPPSSEEVDAFVADGDPQAFKRVVERLLASSQYGEHWARHWLDLARYSDTKGYVYGREEKAQIHGWVYRDWVVRSLNEDLPYNRFLELQVAADQLEPANSAHLAALGFLTLGRRFLGVPQDIIDDRIDVLMRSTQGLSVGCARCHDHKFDPIPTADYYALYGVFQSCAETTVPSGYVETQFPEFEEQRKKQEGTYLEALQAARKERAGQLRRSAKSYLLAQLELEKYPDQNFSQILGAADVHPLIVHRWQQFLERRRQRPDPVFLPWHRFADLAPERFEVEAPAVCRALHALPPGDLHPAIAALFVTAPKTMREVAERYGALFEAVETRTTVAEKKNQPLPEDEALLREVLSGPDSPCGVPDEDLVNIEWFFPTGTVVALWKKQGDLDRHIAKAPEAAPFARILVDRKEPVTPVIFKRGNPLNKGDAVPRRFLQVLSAGDAPPFRMGSGRLELARSISSAANPLTARVMVNRVWMHHFGRGIVATPSDFGKRGDAPTHPELLDWLAFRFMEEGWSLKKLHRWILLSAVYQQTSHPSLEDVPARKAADLDVENTLLWRMNMHKLGFEQMRDAWLAVSGELDLQVGGKPADFFAAKNFRRSIYGLVNREAVPPALRTFDFANPDLSIPRRSETIVPQQALFLFNSPYLAQRARALALRTKNAPTDEQRIATLYRRVFQRGPFSEEVQAALTLVRSEEGATTLPSQTALGRWEQLSQMLLLSNEFQFLD